jgi:hypothetical protein
MPADPLASHYAETLRLIQELAMADVPRYLRTKPWTPEKLAPVAAMLAQGARMAAAEKRPAGRRAA